MTIQHVALFSGKGGVGKTTLAVSLAQYAQRLLLDADPQCSASDWADMRDNPQPEVIAAPLARLPRLVEQYPSSIIDMPGSLSAGAVAALQAVDLTLVVTGDHQFELNAIRQSVDIVRTAGTRMAVLLNKLHPFTDPTAVIEAIESLDVEVCPVVVRERSPHYKALVLGQTAIEYDPEGAAASEVIRLWNWIQEQG